MLASWFLFISSFTMVYFEVIADIQCQIFLNISLFFIHNKHQENIDHNYISNSGYIQLFSHYSLQ